MIHLSVFYLGANKLLTGCYYVKIFWNL